MKLVKQEGLFGCGVACVASLLNCDYKSALNLFVDGNKKAHTTGFYCRDIIKALEGENLRYEHKYIKSKTRNYIYKQGAVVFVRRSGKYPEGHYLCRLEGLWMDPWINFPSEEVKAGFRKKLPEKPIYVIYPVTTV